MRQAGVILERRFIFPPRMNGEEMRIANRPKRVNAQAARLLARRNEDVTQHFCHGALGTGTRVKSRKDEQLHFISPLFSSRLIRSEAGRHWSRSGLRDDARGDTGDEIATHRSGPEAGGNDSSRTSVAADTDGVQLDDLADGQTEV